MRNQVTTTPAAFPGRITVRARVRAGDETESNEVDAAP